MEVKLLNFAGMQEALLGLGLSFGVSSGVKMGAPVNFLADQPLFDRLLQRAKKQISKSAEERKFLRQIILWLDIRAPRYWWSHFDTYKFADKQSESIEHTIMSKPIKVEDFEGGIDLDILDRLNGYRMAGEKRLLRKSLPESYLQRRVACLSLESLLNIFRQRRKHAMPEWAVFCAEAKNELLMVRDFADLLGS